MMEIENNKNTSPIVLKDNCSVSIVNLIRLKLDLDYLDLDTSSFDIEDSIDKLSSRKRQLKSSIYDVLGKSFKLCGYLDKNSGRHTNYYIIVTGIENYKNFTGYVVITSRDLSETKLVIDRIGLHKFSSFTILENGKDNYTLYKGSSALTSIDRSVFYKVYNSAKLLYLMNESM